MIIGINALTGYGKSARSILNAKKSVQSCIGFKSAPLKSMRNASLAIAATTVLSALSACSFFKKPSVNDVAETKTLIENNDSIYTSIVEYGYRDNRTQRRYHYLPMAEEVNSDNYSWSELIYPDGKIERDSMGYKISITPDGKRTVVHNWKDESGHENILKEYPDGTKIERINYNTGMPNEVLYTETKYWPNGNMKECYFYNEYLSNSNKQEKVVEKSIHKYNEDEVLLMWESSQIDSMRSSKHNKYDKKGRLVYDDVLDEKYQYNGNSKTPYSAISEKDGCKHIKLLNTDGSVQREYFKAQDGTITECDVN